MSKSRFTWIMLQRSDHLLIFESLVLVIYDYIEQNNQLQPPSYSTNDELDVSNMNESMATSDANTSYANTRNASVESVTKRNKKEKRMKFKSSNKDLCLNNSNSNLHTRKN